MNKMVLRSEKPRLIVGKCPVRLSFSSSVKPFRVEVEQDEFSSEKRSLAIRHRVFEIYVFTNNRAKVLNVG